jgi:long-chain acyl-CoA synthetase
MQIREHAEAHPERPAVILHPSGKQVSFAEMEAGANRLAHHFRQAGLVEGDSVAVLMENNEHLHTVMWAARRSGLYYAPINTHLTPAEAAYIVDNSGAKAVISSRATRKVCEGLEEHLPNGLSDLLIIADDDLDGWQRYPECVADRPPRSPTRSKVNCCSIHREPPGGPRASGASFFTCRLPRPRA